MQHRLLLTAILGLRIQYIEVRIRVKEKESWNSKQVWCIVDRC